MRKMILSPREMEIIGHFYHFQGLENDKALVRTSVGTDMKWRRRRLCSLSLLTANPRSPTRPATQAARGSPPSLSGCSLLTTWFASQDMTSVPRLHFCLWCPRDLPGTHCFSSSWPPGWARPPPGYLAKQK